MYPDTRALILKTLRQASDAAKQGDVRSAIVFSRTAQALEDQAMDEPGGLYYTVRRTCSRCGHVCANPRTKITCEGCYTHHTKD